MNFPEMIFKAYDIRGLVDGQLSPELAYRIARAFVHVLRSENTQFDGKKLVVGYDMRPTSIPFKDQVIRGFQDEGVDVVDIGMASTPLFNFACAHFAEHAGGIMVTASHNPAEWNGFKLTRADGLPIGQGSGMEMIRDLVQTAQFVDAPSRGIVSTRDVREEYFSRVFSLVNTSSFQPLTVVIDYGNGMGNVTFASLIKKIPGLRVHSLYAEPDGTFPNHEANPLKVETLKVLCDKVREVQADFGFALDGDADRIGVVNEKGEVVEATYVATLLGLEVLRKHPGMHMLYDLRSSLIARDVWQAHGATTEMCMIGHALIKNMMKKVGASFASELSLHIFFGDMYNLESTDLAFLYYVQLLSREEVPLSQLIEPLKRYFHSGEMNFEVEDKVAMMAKVLEKYKSEAIEISQLDGVYMRFDWGWLSVRQSNTEPVLRLNLEATTQEIMQIKVQELSGLLREAT